MMQNPHPTTPSEDAEAPVFQFSAPQRPAAPRTCAGKACPRCGSAHPSAAAACGHCGQPFQTRSAPPRRRRPALRGLVAGLALAAAVSACLPLFLSEASRRAEFRVACACYGQDRARQEQARGRPPDDPQAQAAYWVAYARARFVLGSDPFPGGERVLLYDPSQNNRPCAFFVLRRAGGGWERLPDRAGLPVAR